MSENRLKEVILETNLKGLKLFKRGKVRDIYELDDKLLIVATDRISAFDVVLPTGIPDKGRVLSQLSVFWFNWTKPIVKSHLITDEFDRFPEPIKDFAFLNSRSILVEKSKSLPVECVVRGFLFGSAFEEYKKSHRVIDIELPEGLEEASRLDRPIFTPATKTETGHDINIGFSEMTDILGSKRLAEEIREISLELYKQGFEYAYQRGIIIADTKFEFGLKDGDLILIDEIFTPDSSRFWDLNSYQSGISPESFDKQYVRDYLIRIGWNKRPPGPELPEEVVKNTRLKYLEVFYRLTGREIK